MRTKYGSFGLLNRPMVTGVQSTTINSTMKKYSSQSEDSSSAKFHEKYKGSPFVVKAELREERAKMTRRNTGDPK